MTNYLTKIASISLIYIPLIVGSFSSLDAYVQEEEVDPIICTGVILSVRDDLIRQEEVSFRAMVNIDCSGFEYPQTRYLECHKGEDKEVLNQRFRIGTKFKLIRLDKIDSYVLEACSDNLFIRYPMGSRN